MTLVESELGLWFSATACTLAAVLCLYGAMAGIIVHRIPRILLGVATAVIAVSYWVEMTDHLAVAVDMRRGAGWVLWPALGWTAWSGVRYSRQVVDAASRIIGHVK